VRVRFYHLNGLSSYDKYGFVRDSMLFRRHRTYPLGRRTSKWCRPYTENGVTLSGSIRRNASMIVMCTNSALGVYYTRDDRNCWRISAQRTTNRISWFIEYDATRVVGGTLLFPGLLGPFGLPISYCVLLCHTHRTGRLVRASRRIFVF